MSLIRDLIDGVMIAAPILGGTLLVARLTKRATPTAADVHDLSDYHAPAAEPVRVRRTLRPSPAVTTDILPPAPPGTRVSLSLYAEVVVAQVVARYGSSPEEIAARWLREIAVEQRAVAA